MFDYVETRAIALAPDDVAAAAPAVLGQATSGAPLALGAGRWSVTSTRRAFQTAPSYFVTLRPAPGDGTVVEVRVQPSISFVGWAVLVVCFFVFFPLALLLLFNGRERFRQSARLGAASIFAALGTTSGLVAAGYAAAPPPPLGPEASMR